MNIQIRETGERKTLSIIDNNSGVNWVQDLIGNAGALSDGQFVWSDDNDAYLTSQETYDWWAQYIADDETTSAEIDALAEELGIEVVAIREAIAANTGDDYEQHRREAIAAMQDIRDEHAVTSAAATLGRKGGQSTSAAKSDAARRNGLRGGRPRSITRSWLEQWLAAHRPDLGLLEMGPKDRDAGLKGFYRLDTGPAFSFQSCGKTWRAVAAMLEAVESKEPA